MPTGLSSTSRSSGAARVPSVPEFAQWCGTSNPPTHLLFRALPSLRSPAHSADELATTASRFETVSLRLPRSTSVTPHRRAVCPRSSPPRGTPVLTRILPPPSSRRGVSRTNRTRAIPRGGRIARAVRKRRRSFSTVSGVCPAVWTGAVSPVPSSGCPVEPRWPHRRHSRGILTHCWIRAAALARRRHRYDGLDAELAGPLPEASRPSAIETDASHAALSRPGPLASTGTGCCSARRIGRQGVVPAGTAAGLETRDRHNKENLAGPLPPAPSSFPAPWWPRPATSSTALATARAGPHPRSPTPGCESVAVACALLVVTAPMLLTSRIQGACATPVSCSTSEPPAASI